MTKNFIKRFLPDEKKLKNYKWFKLFGNRLLDPNLWHFNRSSVAKASSIGLFVAYIPAPGHMLLAAFLSLIFRANLPFSVLLVWVANPLTMVPMYAAGYALGAWLLEMPLIRFEARTLLHLHEIWKPLFLGCLLIGAILAILGYITTRLLWRYNVVRNWKKRQERQKASKT